MQLRNVTNPFNFDELLKSHLSAVLEQKKIDEEPKKSQSIQTRKEKAQGCTYINCQSECMAFKQTETMLIYAFSLSKLISKKVMNKPLHPHHQAQQEIFASITIYIFDKIDGNYQTKILKLIQGKPISMIFSFGSTRTNQLCLYLLIGTQNGQLKSVTFHKNISITSFQCSSFPISSILNSPWKDICIILCKDQTIMIVNFVDKLVLAQLAGMRLPLDLPLTLKINNTGEYLLQASKYGTIRLWRINQQILNAIQISGKSFSSRSIISISSLAPKGMIWVDFIGTFFGIITAQYLLKIVAISVNLMNQAQQNFQVLSWKQLANDPNQIIFDTSNFPLKHLIIIGKKNKQKTWLELNHYDQDYKINLIIVVDLLNGNNLLYTELKISQDLFYFLLRDKNGFLIGYQENIFKSAGNTEINYQNTQDNQQQF